VTDESLSSDPDRDLLDIDIDGARPARLLNYLAGGDGNFVVDREAGDYVAAVLPEGIDTARANVQAMEVFIVSVVRYLANDAGVRQFLNIGASIPTANDVHEVAQAAAPDSRVVYVGSDPVVLAHAHARRRSTPQGATAYVHGTLRDPHEILRQAAVTLDMTQPVAVILPVTLNFVPDEKDPYGIVDRLLGGVPSGSYLVIAHTTDDTPADGTAEASKRLSETLREPYVVRSQVEIGRFFDGLEAVGPGLVQVDQWHPHQDHQLPHPERLIPIYVGVGRKP
jgi:hypothetical protein